MNNQEIDKLQFILSEMFPTLRPGLILFELGISVHDPVDWEQVKQEAIKYAQLHKPDFLPRLERVKS
jgi:hypothetical protein